MWCRIFEMQIMKFALSRVPWACVALFVNFCVWTFENFEDVILDDIGSEIIAWVSLQ